MSESYQRENWSVEFQEELDSIFHRYQEYKGRTKRAFYGSLASALGTLPHTLDSIDGVIDSDLMANLSNLGLISAISLSVYGAINLVRMKRTMSEVEDLVNDVLTYSD